MRARHDGESRRPNQRTSVMTHIAWVPPEWVEAAERTLEGMEDSHPSRTIVLVAGAGRGVGHRRRPVRALLLERATSAVASEVIWLRLRGDRAAAPASLVLPLAISDLPVFLRWRGEPPFGAPHWEQLVERRRPARRRLVGVGRAALPRARGGLRPRGGLRHRVGAHVRLAREARRAAGRGSRAGDPRARPARRGGAAARLAGVAAAPHDPPDRAGRRARRAPRRRGAARRRTSRRARRATC